jgi:hypothetical protein
MALYLFTSEGRFKRTLGPKVVAGDGQKRGNEKCNDKLRRPELLNPPSRSSLPRRASQRPSERALDYF